MEVERPRAIVTLLTDFGQVDTYVGQMKGAMLSIAPTLSYVDITHAVAPQDVRAGAFLLWTAVEAFPPGTVHLAVVDPGVGSSRRGVALATARGDYLVGPDNGLLTPAAERLGGITGAVQLATPTHASTTFHGRDVFAPTAARLASGTPLSDLGAPVTKLVPLAVAFAEGEVGEVIHIDTYGNLITNFPAHAAIDADAVLIGGCTAPIQGFYAEVARGELLAVIGSAGLIEISVRDGSAQHVTSATRGTRVTIRRRQRPPE